MPKLTFLFLTIIVFAASALFPISPSRASGSQPPGLTKDGASDPASIPDYVAYEFFFRSLVTSPSEGNKGQLRIEAFARQAGLEDSQINVLLTEARNFYQQISSYDKQIRTIKDQTWPNPQTGVWLNLKGIQKEKEAAIIQEGNAILARRHGEAGKSLAQFINKYVKHRVKGYADMPMPGQSSRTHHMFAHATQMQETVYVYSNTVYDAPQTYVYGYGDVSATGGSYGHEYSPRIEMQGPGSGQYVSQDSSSFPMELCDGDICYDDYYVTNIIALVFCPILNGTYTNGSSQSNRVVAPFIRVNAFGSFNPNPVNEGLLNNSSISLSITASSNATATVNIEPSYIVVSGSAPISIGAGVVGGNNFSITRGTTVARTIGYAPVSVTTNPTRIKAEAVVSANINVINSNPNSVSILTINK